MTNLFPKSLLEDKTKLGIQCTVLHYIKGHNPWLSLDNGILTLFADGTWQWQPRLFQENLNEGSD